MTQANGKTYGSSTSGAIITSNEYFAGTGMITVGLLGDYNDDSRVDAADYVYWRKNDGSTLGYNVWRANFGNAASGSGSSLNSAGGTVPEPSVFLLVALSFAALVFQRGHRRPA